MLITSIDHPHDPKNNHSNNKRRNNNNKIKNEISSITVNSVLFGNDGNTLYSIGESDKYIYCYIKLFFLFFFLYLYIYLMKIVI